MEGVGADDCGGLHDEAESNVQDARNLHEQASLAKVGEAENATGLAEQGHSDMYGWPDGFNPPAPSSNANEHGGGSLQVHGATGSLISGQPGDQKEEVPANAHTGLLASLIGGLRASRTSEPTVRGRDESTTRSLAREPQDPVGGEAQQVPEELDSSDEEIDDMLLRLREFSDTIRRYLLKRRTKRNGGEKPRNRRPRKAAARQGTASVGFSALASASGNGGLKLADSTMPSQENSGPPPPHTQLATWTLLVATPQQLTRPWLNIQSGVPVLVTGMHMREFMDAASDVTVPVFEALIRLLRVTDKSGYKHFVPADWAINVLDGGMDMPTSVLKFSSLPVEYNMKTCALVMVPVIVKDTWTCYCNDMGCHKVSVWDPLLIRGETVSREEAHNSVVSKIASEAVRCMMFIRNDASLAAIDWACEYWRPDIPRCSRTHTGVYTINTKRFYNSSTPAYVIPWNDEDATESRRKLAYELAQMQDNAGGVPQSALRL